MLNFLYCQNLVPGCLGSQNHYKVEVSYNATEHHCSGSGIKGIHYSLKLGNFCLAKPEIATKLL